MLEIGTIFPNTIRPLSPNIRTDIITPSPGKRVGRRRLQLPGDAGASVQGGDRQLRVQVVANIPQPHFNLKQVVIIPHSRWLCSGL